MTRLLFIILSLSLGITVVAVAEQDITLDTEHGSLAGTLTLPDSAEPRAVVLIVAGSGPTDRDGNSMVIAGKNNSLRYLSNALAADGLATLRFDKRLIGASTSSSLTEADLRFDTYVDDVKLWAASLQQRFDQPLYLLGHSEGGLIATIAAQDLKVAGLVSIAGSGRPAQLIIREQLQTQLPPPLMAEAETALDALQAGQLVESPPPSLAALFRSSVQPYLISWFRYDPAAEVGKLEIPVLVVHGSTDLQIPTRDAELLAAANPRANLRIIEGMNHVLKEVSGDMILQMPSYSDPSLPLASELIDALLEFLR